MLLIGAACAMILLTLIACVQQSLRGQEPVQTSTTRKGAKRGKISS
jgi:hypothetical protein